MSPEGSWEVVSTLSTHLSVNTPLCFASFSSYLPPRFSLFHISLFLFASLAVSHFSGYQDTMQKCTWACWGQNNPTISPGWWSHKRNGHKHKFKESSYLKALHSWISREVTCFENWITAKCLCISNVKHRDKNLHTNLIPSNPINMFAFLL